MVTGSGQTPPAHFLRTGTVNSDVVGELIMVNGRVQVSDARRLRIDDGSGGLTVLLDTDLPWDWPDFAAHPVWAIRGVVGLWDGDPVLWPRFPSDLSPPPAWLPVTGGRQPQS